MRRGLHLNDEILFFIKNKTIPAVLTVVKLV